jgi:putative ABC transport system permease protein
MEKFFQDLRFALRVYAKNRSFTIVAVLALAIGIGSNIAVFTVVNAMLFRSLPYPDGDRLVQVGRSLNQGPNYTMSYARFRFLEQNNRAFESLAAYDVVGSSLSLTLGETPELVQSSRVSANLFRVLQINPLLGRDFKPEDDKSGVAPVAIISHSAWSRLFGNDPNVVGRLVRMSGEPYTIIGVMPADFRFGADTEAWITIRKTEDWSDRSNPHLVIGRLRSGTTIETAHSDLTTVFQRLKEEQPASIAQTEVGALITPYRERVVGNTRVPLLLLAGVVGCVLLIACANVANLLFARAIRRRQEMAVRIALGINQSRMIGQLLTESFLLSAISGIVGLLFAISALGVFELWLPVKLPRIAELNIDSRVLLFSLAGIALTSIVFGLAPALQLAKMDPAQTLRELSGATPGRGTRRLQAGLVSLQIALSTVLLLTAGLLLISFQKLRNVDLGYDAKGVLIIQTSLASPEFAATERATLRVQHVIERLKTIPEVKHVATVTRLPTEPSLVLSFELLSGGSHDGALQANWRAVTPEFFEALRIPLRDGRSFNDRDTRDAPRVAIVNETFVSKFLKGTNPLGQRLVIGRDIGENFADEPREIVGVVEDTLGNTLSEAAAPGIFIPAAQVPDRTTAFLNQIVPLNWVVQVTADPIAASDRIRREVSAADSSLVASKPRPLVELLSGLTAQQKMYATLMTFFAAVALFLGAVGLHGVISHSVAERRHELGIRFALGASRGRLLWLMVTYGLKLLVPGLVAGIILSLALRSVVASYLFGVSTTYVLVYLAVILLLSLIAMIATLGPAMRATKVDLTTVLRQ